jgi:hypothetical protein
MTDRYNVYVQRSSASDANFRYSFRTSSSSIDQQNHRNNTTVQVTNLLFSPEVLCPFLRDDLDKTAIKEKNVFDSVKYAKEICTGRRSRRRRF